ncbi:MAG: CBS domain-containing protein [Candidatus Methylomirabilales bacterium]
MQVKDWMERRPVTISPQETLLKAWRLIRERRVRHLPVVDGGRVVGIVTDRDLRQALPSRAVGLELHEAPHLAEKVRIWEVMSRVVVTVRPDAPVEEATDLLLRYRIGGLPVVNGDILVGIITKTDLLRAFLHRAEPGLGRQTRSRPRTKTRKLTRRPRRRSR